MILSQWAILVRYWAFPDRSLATALKVIQQHALCLATALHTHTLLGTSST